MILCHETHFMASLKTSAITLLQTTTGINAKTIASTSLYAGAPTGYNLIVTKIVIRVTAFTSGGKTVQAIASFGGNGASYNDYSAGATYTVSAVTKALHEDPAEATELPIYTAGTQFFINITTGSNATTETWACDVFGYLVSA